jgi:hypothetical protein
MACQRYIELNPVRAGMVDDPANYRWTSYRRHAFGEADARLTLRALPKPRYERWGATGGISSPRRIVFRSRTHQTISGALSLKASHWVIHRFTMPLPR